MCGRCKSICPRILMCTRALMNASHAFNMYGPFAFLCASSSVVGAVAYMCDMRADIALANAGDPSVKSAANPTDLNRTLSVSQPHAQTKPKSLIQMRAQIIVEQQVFPFIAVFDICYPLEFLLITNLKLLVLHRFCSVALKASSAFRNRRLSLAPFHIVVVLINCLNTAGVALRCAAARHRLQAASAAAALVAQPASASVDDMYRLLQTFFHEVDSSKEFASNQLLIEAAALATMALVRTPSALHFPSFDHISVT
jgi:hypothetical protein